MSNKAIDKDYLLRQLQGFEGDVLAQKSIATETGYHNFRYYNNKFSYKNGNTWTDIDVGNTNYTELTQAAYNQLSEAEKNNGTFYFITDSPSGGGGGGVSPDFIAPTESSTTASQAYAIGALFFLDNTLYRVTTAISQGDTIVTTGVSANVAETTVEEELSDKANNTSSFSDASSRTNIASGDTIPTILGKIKKWFTDLADLAFIAKDGNESTKYLRGDGTWQSFPSFSTSLSGLTDTTISSEANKDILEYNSTTSKWENEKNSMVVRLASEGETSAWKNS